MEHKDTAIAASLQARHGPLQHVAAGLPASIAVLHWSPDNHQPANVVGFPARFDGFSAPFDDIRAPTTCKTPLFACICRLMINGRQMQANGAPNPPTFRVRKPSELLRRLTKHGRSLSDRASHRARMLIRRSVLRVQCPVHRAQCFMVKQPDGCSDVPS